MIKRLAVFDFDDTIVVSDAKIKIHEKDTGKELMRITPAQFNFHVKEAHHTFDFEEFESLLILRKAKMVSHIRKVFKRYYDVGRSIAIISARGNKQIMIDFMKMQGFVMKPSMVFAIHSIDTKHTGSIAERKQQALSILIKKGFNRVTFYDDNYENLKAVKLLETSQVKIKTIHVTADENKEAFKQKSRRSSHRNKR